MHRKPGESCRLTGRLVMGFLAVGCVWGGPVKTLAAGVIVACMYLVYQQWRQPTTNAGHRAGGKGFTGEAFALSSRPVKNEKRE